MTYQLDFGLRFPGLDKTNYNWSERLSNDRIDYVADVDNSVEIVWTTKRNQKTTKISVRQKFSDNVSADFQFNVVAVMGVVDSLLCETETKAILDRLGFGRSEGTKVTGNTDLTFGPCKYSLQVKDGLVFTVEPVESAVKRYTRALR